MPIPVWDAAQFAQYYKVRDRDPDSLTNGQRFGYGRRFAQLAQAPLTDGIEFYDTRWGYLTDAFPIQASDRVIVVGCAFGFLIEAAHAAGFPNVWGVDNSPHVEADPDSDLGVVGIVFDDIRGGGRTKAAMRALTGDDVFEWIIVEDVDTGYDDQDVIAGGGFIEGFRTSAQTPMTNIIHMVTTLAEGAQPNPTYPDMAYKVLADWKALVPSHSWMALRDGEVL